MDDLAERVAASLDDVSADLWFPELTPGLTTRQWAKLGREIGLTPENYGTARVMARNISAPREIVTSLNPRGTNVRAISIEALPEEIAVQYEQAGFRFYSSEETLNTTVFGCLEDAVALLGQVPSLMETVFALVRSLHIIKPRDSDLDESFSEPRIPFSVFVSVPQTRIANDSIRVAEALVHEAMHLQLTLMEQTLSLVKPSSKEYFSPWRSSYRPPEGILHAIYVFGVINQFLRKLIFENSAVCLKEYIRNRREEIGDQLSEVSKFDHCSDLTSMGSRMVKIVTQAQSRR